jgi:hypothetical protein
VQGIVDGKPTAEERKDAIRASIKPYATVLDFVGASKCGIVTATDVLGGNFDIDIRNAADDVVGAARNGEMNVREAIAKARSCLLLEAEEQRRRPLRDTIKDVEVKYFIGDIDPHGSLNGRQKTKSRGGSTDSQVAALVNLGVDRETALGYSKRQAGAVMTSVREQRCTIRQAKTLRKFGYDPENFNAETAHVQIQKIADNGWKRPAERQPGEEA